MAAALLRISVSSLLIGALVVGGYWHLRQTEQQRLNAELRALNEEMAQRLEEREAMMDRLTRSRRVAHVYISDQQLDGEGRPTRTTVRLIELNSDGRSVGEQTFTIPGGVLFIDAWTARFDPSLVAAGHPLYGRTLILLRRVYSELMAPIDGFAIDTPGAIPPGYAADDPGRYEKQLWDQFWQIATDAALARRMQVRVAQGEAVYKPVKAGQVYELIVDAAAGMSLVPLDEQAATVSASSPRRTAGDE